MIHTLGGTNLGFKCELCPFIGRFFFSQKIKSFCTFQENCTKMHTDFSKLLPPQPYNRSKVQFTVQNFSCKSLKPSTVTLFTNFHFTELKIEFIWPNDWMKTSSSLTVVGFCPNSDIITPSFWQLNQHLFVRLYFKYIHIFKDAYGTLCSNMLDIVNRTIIWLKFVQKNISTISAPRMLFLFRSTVTSWICVFFWIKKFYHLKHHVHYCYIIIATIVLLSYRISRKKSIKLLWRSVSERLMDLQINVLL